MMRFQYAYRTERVENAIQNIICATQKIKGFVGGSADFSKKTLRPTRQNTIFKELTPQILPFSWS
jgi:hypothetical protein